MAWSDLSLEEKLWKVIEALDIEEREKGLQALSLSKQDKLYAHGIEEGLYTASSNLKDIFRGRVPLIIKYQEQKRREARKARKPSPF